MSIICFWNLSVLEYFFVSITADLLGYSFSTLECSDSSNYGGMSCAIVVLILSSSSMVTMLFLYLSSWEVSYLAVYGTGAGLAPMIFGKV